MRKDATNLASLVAIQGANALVPLVIFPFALRVVGADRYAEIVLAEALILMAGPLVLYSFEVDGTARVVGLQLEKDRDRLARIFSTIFWIRLVACLGCLLVVLAVATIFEVGETLLVAAWSLTLLAGVFQSAWLFVGLQQNTVSAVFTAVSRVLATVGVVFLVRAPPDYLLVPLMVGGAYLLGGVATFVYVLLVMDLKIVSVARADIFRFLVEGKEIFAGNLSVVLYRDTNVFLLGMVGASAPAVAAYSIAEKGIKCLQAVVRPLNQLFFPKAVQAMQVHCENGVAALRSLSKLTMPQIGCVLLLGVSVAVALLFARPWVEHWIPPETLTHAAPLMGIMFFAIPFGIANFMIGTAGLNYLGCRQYYFKAIFMAGVASVAGCIVLARAFEASGAAIVYTASEALLLSLVVARYFKLGTKKSVANDRV